MIQAVLITRDKELRALVHTAAEDLPLKIAQDARSLKEAMDTFRDGSVKIVVLDLFLGESSGLDAIKTLRKLDESLVVMLVSRLRGREQLEKAFRSGASDVLLYPCRMETIRETLRHRLSHEACFRIDDGDHMARGGDPAVFPCFIGNGQLPAACAWCLRDPNRAVEVHPSAALFQFIVLFDGRILIECGIDNFDARMNVVRHNVVAQHRQRARTVARRADDQHQVALPANAQHGRPTEQRDL